MVDSLVEKLDRVVVCHALHILRKRNGHRAPLCRVGEHTHRMDERSHNLLWPGNAVEIAAYGTECVVCADGSIVRYLELLQHGVWLAVGKDIAGQKKHRDMVHGCGASCGDHVEGSRAD